MPAIGVPQPIDLGLSEEDWAEVPTFGVPEPTPERLTAELATLPAKAPRKAPSVHLTHKEAAALLGVSRGTLRNLIKDGKIRHLGKDRQERNLVDRIEIEALVADRAEASFERKATGAAAEQQRLARGLGLGEDPRVLERDARGRGAGADQRRMQQEQLDAMRAVKSEIEFGFQRLLSELRSQTQHLAALQESLSALNTGALIAAGAVAAVAVTPADVKADLLEKIRAPFRKKPVDGVAPAIGKLRTVTGEVVERQPLEEPDLRELSEGLDQVFDRMRVATTGDGKD